MDKKDNIINKRVKEKNNKKLNVIIITMLIVILIACVICGSLVLKKLYIDERPADNLIGKAEKEYLRELDSKKGNDDN